MERNKPKYVDYNEERPLESLRHCRVVLHTQDYVCTGVVNFVEGDIIEVELTDDKPFQLGDPVKISIYSAFGLIFFTTVIVAVAAGAIVVMNPPEIKRRWSLKEKREHVRVEVSEQGLIRSIFRVNGKLRVPLERELSVQIENVSIGGIGFSITEDMPLNDDDWALIEVDLGHPFSLLSQIVQKRTISGKKHFYIGAKFVKIEEEHVNKLKSVVMHRQISQYYRTKQEMNRRV